MIDHCPHTRLTMPSGRYLSLTVSGSVRWLQTFVFSLACTVAFGLAGQAQTLSNDTVLLQLNVTPEGIPVIEEGIWLATGQTAFRDLGTQDGLGALVPAALIPTTQTAPPIWTISEGNGITTAEATRELNNKMRITWIVELPDRGQLFRLRIRMSNGGKKARAVESFPAWSARWNIGEQSQRARWWQSLEYNRIEQSLDAGNQIRLGSRLHSSDDADNGVNPYWVVGGSNSRIYFGLEWCGGWSARLDGLANGFTFSVGLPREETQLVLNKGETIEGPALLVTPMPGTDDTDDRAFWMRQRRALARLLYSGPRPSFPLSYNHWYAARRQVNGTFLNQQIAAMPPYSFDAFIIDAGWFGDGRWKPDPAKFGHGEMIEMLTSLKAIGIRPGLWSTPQYLSEESTATLAIEEPPIVSRFFDGALVDMSDDGFPDYLKSHVQKLRSKYSMDYWKYDQAFFTDHSRAGEMKNVIGLQAALRAVRNDNPDLTIENCQLGGRMINEFTLLATQTTWLRDAGNRGLEDPRVNIRVALNALEFVFPWAALRFTINLDQMDQNDDEMTRLYCRSAMAGRWGISADLSQIGERQRNVILTEIQHYRRLNFMKYSSVYDLQLPNDRANIAGATFYSGGRSSAGVLLYRWQASGAFEQRVMLPKLNPSITYRVVDVDTGTEITTSGSDLISNGVAVAFGSNRLSAVLFVEKVKVSPGS
jgi:melibiase-like protein